MSLRHKSRRVLRFGVCSVVVLTTFWATHEWERRATLREYRWTSGVAAEEVAERAGLQAAESEGHPASYGEPTAEQYTVP